MSKLTNKEIRDKVVLDMKNDEDLKQYAKEIEGLPQSSFDNLIKAIDKAYIKGQIETKEQYQRIIEHQRSEIYNEGYRDGKSDSYTKADIDRAYQKGYYAGQKEVAIQKAEPAKLTQTRDDRLVCNSGTSSHLFIHNGTASTTLSTIRVGL